MKKRQRFQANSILKAIKSKGRANFFISLLLLVSFLNLVVGCSYYKVKSVDANSMSSKIQPETPKGKAKYIIIHSGSQKWHLSDVTFNEGTKEVSGTLAGFDESHNLYQPKPGKSGAKYKRGKSDKTAEVHIYTDKAISDSSGQQITIPYSDISKVELYDSDSGRAVLSVVGITLGVIVLLSVIILATKSSCPFVYVNDGATYAFNGEIYPGAILPNLERDDYLKLNGLRESKGFFKLKITNELKEIQNTDLTELIVVNHSENATALMAQNGEVYTLQNEMLPINAYCNDIKVSVKPFLTVDKNYYSFNTNESTTNPNEVVLEFDNNQKSDLGKLHLNLKNTYWMDYMYGKFNEEFGSYYNSFHKKQRKLPKETCEKWRSNQYIPLAVYMKQENEWKFVENINTVGPLSARDIVVPIPLSATSEKVEIKLVSGYMFWDLDYAGMDFSKNENVKVTTLKPTTATDENGNNVTALLSEKDKKYLVQPSIGNEVTLNFATVKTSANSKQSFFFKTNGYYEYIRDYKGSPDFAKLKTFREKGALNAFSIELYKDFISDSKNLSLIALKNE
ncbi:hypothetical protein [Flavobacterium sp.]|uniref:hypothetical protein n=1 Tax=Flavobacterium sp. TaxID=239 RepID=UPI0025E9F926|nr:hypothetical protein [Flavobacterium sp.]